MLIVSIFTVSISVLMAFAVIFKNHKSVSSIAFSLGLLSTAAVIFGDTMCILSPEALNEWKRVVYICESLMVVSWLLFALSFARVNFWRTTSIISKVLLLILPVLLLFFALIPIEYIFYSPEFKTEKILFLGNAGFIFNLLLLLYSIMSIVNLEATLKSTSGISRWNIKYTLIGVGGILSINIFYYSHALLYRSIDMNLLPVRAGIIIVSVLLLWFSYFRRKVMDVGVIVSRKVVYRSITIFIVGFYFLGLGVIGEGMRYFGPKVGKNITMFLGFAGAFIVLAVILSETLRRKAIVLINKNFYSQKYDYREQWLKFTRQISMKHSFYELLSSITEGFRSAVGSKGASLWLRDRGSGEFVCEMKVDTDFLDTKPDNKLIEFLKDKKWILNIRDDKCRKVVTNSGEFLEMTMASLIVPLMNMDELIGFVILGEGLAEYEYNYEDYDLLKTLASQATSAILNAKLSEELTEAKEMEAMGRLSSFILHDLKNAASMLSLISQNAEEHIDNPDFQRDTVRAITNSSEKIKRIIEKLKNIPKKTGLNCKSNDLGDCVKIVVKDLHLNGKAKLTFREVESVRTKFDKEEIVKVITNLIINALDATDNRGEIEVAVGKEANMAFVMVADNGCGMSKEFIEKNLFKPFYTTKKKGLGIGLYQSKTIVEAHAGKIKIESLEGRGTRFFVYLPLE